MVRRAVLASAVALASVTIGACSNPLGKQYEYEEQVYLEVSGAATAIVDASVPALVALRGARLDPSPTARIDQEDVRKAFEASGCHVVRVGQPWRRDGRRFVQVRVDADNVVALGQCGLLGWSQYRFEPAEGGLHFEQIVGAPAAGNPGNVNWDGTELVAFKLHAPSRVLFHNVRRLEDNSPGSPERGNILVWEQTLADRRAGKPLHLDVLIERETILSRTIWLFGGSFAAAVIVLATIVWLTVLRGKRLKKLEVGRQK